ncbi:MAG: hypothetical protein ABIG20_02335 [archaeon]
MMLIMHRVNTIEGLKNVSAEYGVEVDVRTDGNKLILNHEPMEGGDELEEYLKEYKHKFIIFNIKEAGIEDKVRALAEKYKVKDYFLLDVEFPYIYKAARSGVKNIAIRFSEDEPIEAALEYRGKVDWVWIDTNTKLPLDADVVEKLKGFKTCLVCPSRWGRPEDIKEYKEKISELGIKLDAVMTEEKYVGDWK